jgi:hypothetical protein
MIPRQEHGETGIAEAAGNIPNSSNTQAAVIQA